MPNPYTSTETVSDVSEAIEFALYYQREGIFDLFRGQSRDWPLQPSISRSTDRANAEARLREFASWVRRSQELQSLHDSDDAIIATAQHYGIPTSFLDWTTDPEVAGYFASGRHSSDSGVIYCIKSSLLEETWENINEGLLREAGHAAVRLVRMHVKDLWRLQSQCGLFLDMHVEPSFFEMLGDVHRITFPKSDHDTGLPKEKIYPPRKSHLETLLDQYFDIKAVDAAVRNLVAVMGPPTLSIPASRGAPSYFLGNALPPPHRSWTSEIVEAWRIEPDEPPPLDVSAHALVLHIPSTQDSLELTEHIAAQAMALMAAQGSHRAPTRWIALDERENRIELPHWQLSFHGDGKEPQGIPFQDVLSWVWDGMRRVPYSDRQIGLCFGNYLAHVVAPNHGTARGNTLGVEFEANRKRARAFCSSRSLVACVRDDFLDIINPRYRAHVEHWFPEDARSFLTILRSPDLLFECSSFIEFFAREIIPAQLAYGPFNRTVLLNPLSIDIFGNS